MSRLCQVNVRGKYSRGNWMRASAVCALTLAFSGSAGVDETTVRSNSAVVASPKPASILLPSPPAKPPIDFFRELLAMTPGERQNALANRPPESQKLIAAKIQEYEALAPEERELRLRVTELRYYLLPLLSSPVTNRTPILERVPAALLPLIEQRLRRWDELPTETQKELLENETWLRHVAETASRTATQEQQALTNMPPAQRQTLEAAVTRWKQMSEDRRQELTQRFEEFFGLRRQERVRTLRAFSGLERLQMERTLESFGKLDPAKRARCVSALDKLAQLTPEERQEFLQNVERWQALTPAERKAWRDLVYNLSLPPRPRIPLPPSPIPPKNMRPPSTMATNQ